MKQKLEDGLHKLTPNGKKRGELIFVKDGALYFPLGRLISPLMAMMIGKPLLVVGLNNRGTKTKTFMRALDVAEEMPHKRKMIEDFVASHGLKL